jgi:hypothetical protein
MLSYKKEADGYCHHTKTPRNWQQTLSNTHPDVEKIPKTLSYVEYGSVTKVLGRL